MGFSFAPNHIGMPLVSPKLKLDFLRRQVLMSRNIRGGAWMSIFMGGLNYQVEHHLFPSMARPHLRKAQPLVAAYCAAEGVPYTQTTIWQAYRSVIGYLNTVGSAERTRSSARWSRNAGRSEAPSWSGGAGRLSREDRPADDRRVCPPRARPRAVALPIPPLAPVTSTVLSIIDLPWIRFICFILSCPSGT